MKTRTQRFAAKTFEQVSSLEKQSKAFRDKYGSLALRLPFLVRSAGLAQALEFVAGSGGDEGRKLLSHLAEVLGSKDQQTLLDNSRTVPLNEYMRLTRDAMTALQWYKRFAQSVLDVEPGKDESR